MRIRSHYFAAASLCLSLAMSPVAHAQVAPGNERGVAMGHLHYLVSDAAASRDFWLALGGVPSEGRSDAYVSLPGLLLQLDTTEETTAAARRDPVSLVDHVALRIDSFEAIEAAGLSVEYLEDFPGIGVIYGPDGEKVELFEDGVATNAGFTADAGYGNETADRHNRPLSAPVVSHHLHLYVPETDVAAARDWYVEYFGATPGMRWRYLAADLPGMNLNFSAAPQPREPTAGRVLDHIGFEVERLEAFCRSLQAQGIVLDEAFRSTASGEAACLLTDPWGTRIELTQGLRQR